MAVREHDAGAVHDIPLGARACCAELSTTLPRPLRQLRGGCCPWWRRSGRSGGAACSVSRPVAAGSGLVLVSCRLLGHMGDPTGAGDMTTGTDAARGSGKGWTGNLGRGGHAAQRGQRCSDRWPDFG